MRDMRDSIHKEKILTQRIIPLKVSAADFERFLPVYTRKGR